MSGNFNKHLDAFIGQRLDEVYEWLAQHDNEFIKLQQEASDLEDRFLEDISEEKRKLFMKYEDKINLQGYHMLEAVYIQGLKDSMRLAERLK